MRAVIFAFWALFLAMACAQKVDDLEWEEQAVIYQASSGGKNRYLSCNRFADETFRGHIWSDSGDIGHEEGCAYVEIARHPQELLKNESLFLQVYPFSIKGGQAVYGKSLPINTLKKSSKEGKKEILASSQIIDTFLVEAELELEPDHFFLDHILEVCAIEDKWAGLQLVIYQRREESSVPLRTSKFLLPPFLAHPEHFRDTKGQALAAHHPFLDLVSELKSQPSAYYDRAEEMCRSFL